MENKMNKITNILRNGNAIDIEVATEPKMRKTGNPYMGRVKKHTAYLGVDFGASYTEEVNKRRLEEGKAADFQAKKSPYEEVNEFFVRKGEQIYLRMLLKKDNAKRVIWEIDGRPATENEVSEIKGFLQGGGCAKNQGLESGNEVEMRVVKIENVVAVGGETWAREVA